MIIKILTATASNSSRYDFWCLYKFKMEADWILKGWYPIFFIKQNNRMINLEKYYACAS